jgi:glycosyltransferase involved in cell wall biosynthesis
MIIYFICPDINKPTGGIKQIYRQVDVLNDNNINAFVLHEENGFRCNWFRNKTRVAYNKGMFKEIDLLNTKKITFIGILKKQFKNIVYYIKNLLKAKNEVKITSKDILVFPEVFGPKIGKILPGIKKVIYNQGAYQTFFNYNLNLDDLDTPYLNSDLLAVIVNSENARKYITHAFPKIDLYRVHYGIDKANFNYSKNKKQQIAFMPRRLRVDLVQVINILKFRGVLKNWQLVGIQNMNEQEVASTLKDSAFFLSFSINEGFGMPPAEAMACGCIVVGYSGKGGEEYFKDEFSYTIADRNVQEYAKKLEKILLSYEHDTTPFLEQSKKASEYILKEYAIEVEQNDIATVWKNIIENNA